MKTSANGRALIAEREGRRLGAYRDGRGILTIGVGHTGRMAGPPVTAGMTITQAQCDAFLAADLAPVEHAINATVTVPMGQNEFDAMASLGFNIGAGGLARSTVVRRLNGGDVAGAASAFMLWDRPPELAARRAAERRQFLEPEAPDGQLAADRAAALAGKAAVATGRARATAAGGGLAAAAGTAATAAAMVAHHGHLAGVAAALCGLGALVDAAAAILHRRAARGLAANAAVHAAARTTGAPATV